VSVKYKTKNIKTETKVNRVWLSGSRVCPLKNITSVIMTITEKKNDSRGMSINKSLNPEYVIIRNPAPVIIIFNNRRGNKYLETGYKLKGGYLIKSLTTV